MSDITFQVENYSDCIEELKELIDSNWEEAGLYNEKLKLNPDYEKVQSFANTENLFIITVRDQGKIVGYTVNLIDSHLHHKDSIFSVVDIIYLKPEYRNSSISTELLIETEAEAFSRNADVMIIGVKTYLPYDALCLSLNFENTERIYTKYLGDNNGS